jgi:hypothetical protein
MIKRAIKKFDVEEGPTNDGGYRIAVLAEGTLIEEFIRGSEHDATEAFKGAGYHFVFGILSHHVLDPSSSIGARRLEPGEIDKLFRGD